MIKVSVIGGSGYAGGELLRLILNHPKLKIEQVTSQQYDGEPIAIIHPNLRNLTNLYFSKISELKPCDLVFVALPNGKSMSLMKNIRKLAPRIIDLGADFRLLKAKVWEKYYGLPHAAPQMLKEFVYGIPEIYPDKIKKAKLIASPGCEAIVSILALYPFIKNKLIREDQIIIDAKMGSSQSGNKPTSSSHHPERAGVVRSYQPTNHRHTAEIQQVLNQFSSYKVTVSISATAIEMVRGILVTIHTFLKKNIGEKDIWNILRKEYKNKPFIRIIKEKRGLYRFPEPKILQGTNFCDIGFEKEKQGNRLVLIGAIDNLVKGTAGNAIQCLNLMMGYREDLGLDFPGLHPI